VGKPVFDTSNSTREKWRRKKFMTEEGDYLKMKGVKKPMNSKIGKKPAHWGTRKLRKNEVDWKKKQIGRGNNHGGSKVEIPKFVVGQRGLLENNGTPFATRGKSVRKDQW